MLLEEILQLISKKTGNYINQWVLAESLGITRQTVSTRIKNESQVTVAELKKIEVFFNINILNEEDGHLKKLKISALYIMGQRYSGENVNHIQETKQRL